MHGSQDPLSSAGIHLTRSDENATEIDELAGLLGGTVGVDAVLDDLNRQGHRTLAPGRAVTWAMTWDRHDRRDAQWWPQGVTTSADASDTEDIRGRRVVAVSWYAKNKQGSRISFIDLATRRYRHVLLVQPVRSADGLVSLAPLRVHAGGIVWCGGYLHVAATAQGFMTCWLDDLLRVPDEHVGDLSTHGYRYVLPVRFAYQAHSAPEEERMRYSFMSLDRGVTPPELIVGEYARGDQTRRLVRFGLNPQSHLLVEDEDGASRPLAVNPEGLAQTQGATVARGRYYLTVSHGASTWGSVYSGLPGAFRRHRWAAPMGPEDIAYWPSTDRLWSVTEHAGRRWVYSMRRSWFDR
ncbi:hypothetical protein FB382_002788 [Nocardioides ginsengisegetis]|uniref:Uncharacterized protein n=1 Tax=Nocardioides ginsengisegetis TaxID=661491 RepID=A0A7W3J1B8_9ACTN|nr:hypothetical protein [Nocardioides ginsengisegetis]MBA8804497.1 hypothetical protein [Nocardioides ginsengisegetis]